MQKKDPTSIIIVRHGQSKANLARHKSENEKLKTIEFPEREMDVPLSIAGEEESRKIGIWLKSQPTLPTLILSSPYLRATETARIIMRESESEKTRMILDERIRERELGIFDRLTNSVRWKNIRKNVPNGKNSESFIIVRSAAKAGLTLLFV